MDQFCVWSKNNNGLTCYANTKDKGPKQCPYSMENIKYAGVYGNKHLFKINGCKNFRLREQYYEGLVERLLRNPRKNP